jgi:DNA-binding transcriptional regulator YhcF (GntR family)
MNGDQLFINLVLRLKNYPEAAVLWSLLREWADDREFKTSRWRMANDSLNGTIDEKTTERVFRSLEAQGLIKVRIHKNTATRITVNQEAVLDLLDQKSFINLLPGQGVEHEINLLRVREERLKAKAEALAAAESAQPSLNAASAAEPAQQAPVFAPSSTAAADPATERAFRSALEQSSDYDNH